MPPTRPAHRVLLVFLKLGLTSFGGPIAHLGYFREEFVVRRRWLDERSYSELIGLCQFLPGPSSSQVGLCIGLVQAGLRGALAAWVGFTLPSAIALVVVALESQRLRLDNGVLHGLQLVAVPIVLQAVWGMGRTFCTDLRRVFIAISAATLVLFGHSWIAQVLAIALAALAGRALLLVASPASSSPATGEALQTKALPLALTRSQAVLALAAFAALLLGLGGLASLTRVPALQELASIYRSGALVFGGGHVVLPLLHEAVVTPGWVTDADFLAGYGAAQAVPGPLFTFGAFLGAVAHVKPNGAVGAALALVAIFLPGLLLVLGVLPFWQAVRSDARALSVLSGVNAAVVGLLAAALYYPIWTGAVHTRVDVGLVATACLLLFALRVPPWVLVGICAGAAAWLGTE